MSRFRLLSVSALALAITLGTALPAPAQRRGGFRPVAFHPPNFHGVGFRPGAAHPGTHPVLHPGAPNHVVSHPIAHDHDGHRHDRHDHDRFFFRYRFGAYSTRGLYVGGYYPGAYAGSPGLGGGGGAAPVASPGYGDGDEAYYPDAYAASPGWEATNPGLPGAGSPYDQPYAACPPTNPGCYRTAYADAFVAGLSSYDSPYARAFVAGAPAGSVEVVAPAAAPPGADELPPPLTDEGRGHVRVLLPADARLWVNGTAMNQTGADRNFTTPVLTPGKNYRYDVRVQWIKDGKPVEQTREVPVSPNQTTTVDFTAPPTKG